MQHVIRPIFKKGYPPKKTSLKKGDVIFYDKESRRISLHRNAEKIYIGGANTPHHGDDMIMWGAALNEAHFILLAELVAAAAGLGMQDCKAPSHGRSYMFC